MRSMTRPKRKSRAGGTIDIRNLQDQVKVDRRFVRRVVKQTLKTEGKSGQVSILLTGNEHIRELNRRYRSVDRVTDVIAFPLDDEVLGDVVVSMERTGQQAREYGVSFENEFARLLAHGVLHLVGYQDTDERHAREMSSKQEAIVREVLDWK